MLHEAATVGRCPVTYHTYKAYSKKKNVDTNAHAMGLLIYISHAGIVIAYTHHHPFYYMSSDE